MKKLLLLPLLFLASCDVTGLRGNGNLVTEQRAVTEFSNISAGGIFRIEWKSGPPSCTVTTDSNLLPYVTVKNDGAFLRLSTERSLNPHRNISVVVTSAKLEGVKLSGATRFTAHQVKGEKFFLSTSGASRVELDGAVDDLTASMSGASRLTASAFPTKRTELSIAGAGRAEVFVTEELKASIAGAGKVLYRGNPRRVQRDISGAGSIKPAE